MSRRPSPGCAKTSTCSEVVATRLWPSATPPAPLTWQVSWPTRNCRWSIRAWPRWCWCRASTAQAQMPTQPKSPISVRTPARSEEHTSELQSLAYLVCRLLRENRKGGETPVGLELGTRKQPDCGLDVVAVQGEQLFFLKIQPPPRCPLFPYPTLCR